MNQTLVPKTDWLDSDSPVLTNTSVTITSGSTTVSNGGLSVGNCTLTPYSTWYPYYYVQMPPRPIKLTLSEIERLRKVAKADAKLKEILAKFTHQIEITVDFD